MSNQPGMTFDLAPLNAALREYAAATGKGLAYSLNRAAKNIAYKAIARVKLGSKEVFQKLSTYEPLVGWYINKLKREGKLPRFSSKRAREIARNNLTAGSTTIDAYHEYASNLILSRKGRVGFIRGFFLRIAKQIEASIPGGGMKNGAKNIPSIQPTIKLATASSLNIDMGAMYNYKNPNVSGNDVATDKVNSMLEAAVDPAIKDAIADIVQYTENVLSKQAKAISVSY